MEKRNSDEIPIHEQLFKSFEKTDEERALENETRLKIEKITKEYDQKLSVSKHNRIIDGAVILLADIVIQMILSPGLADLWRGNPGKLAWVIRIILLIGEKILIGSSLYHIFADSVREDDNLISKRDEKIDNLHEEHEKKVKKLNKK